MIPFRTLTLEITTHCQADCIVCVRDKLKFELGNMSQPLFERAVKEVSELYTSRGGGLECIDFGGMGEPLLDSQIEQKLVWLKEHYPDIRVAVTTNGGLLSVKKDILCKYIDVLKISNYGFTKKSFEAVHRGNLIYENVKKNIEDFLRIPVANRPKVIMSFLVLDENRGEEEEWREYWESQCEELYIWRPHNWAGYYHSDTDRNPEKCRSCGRPGCDFTIRTNGDVSVCCWDFNRELTIGNLEKNSFKEIYEGEPLKRIMQMHQKETFFESENLCRHCDQLYDRSDALLYSSNSFFKSSMKTNSK